MSESIPLSSVRTDGGTQMRAEISEATVATYADQILEGAEFPSIIVFNDGESYWLADGFHRHAAYKRAEYTFIPAEIRTGSYLDAIRFALQANAHHGRQRDGRDLRRAYDVAVKNGLCESHDTGVVAELLCCSTRWARFLTKEARERRDSERDERIRELSSEGWTQRAIADEVGCTQQTVSNVLADQKRKTSDFCEEGDDENPEEQEAKEAKRRANQHHNQKKSEKRAEKQAKRESAQEAATQSDISERCEIRHCSMQELLVQVTPDAIITDPPYPKEYVHLYKAMSELAQDIPLVAVMCGQSYLPQILAEMSANLRYRWTLAYLTPGGQAVQQWSAKVNAFWKPVLLFGDGDWIGDVVKSDVNDNDKEHHHWGQSESGMNNLVSRLTEPGSLICDPFCGAGTTALAALENGCRFIGCDTDADSVATAKERVGI